MTVLGGQLTVRRLAALQWVGLFLGAAIWFTQLVAGYTVTLAQCGDGRFTPASGISIDANRLQAILMTAAAACVLVAAAAAVGVVRETQGVQYDEDGPPLGRIRFLAIAAIPANLLFLGVIVLSGTATIANTGCVHG